MPAQDIKLVLKVIHIGSLIMWLGPALGSWLVLRYVQQQQGEMSSATSLVYKVFFFTLTLEHLAFCFLLISGAWMAFGYGWIDMPWLQNKLWLVLLLAVLTAAGVLLVQRPDLLQSVVPDAPPVTSPPAVPTTGERSEGDN